MTNHSYCGRGFEVWNAGRAWYWLVDIANRGGGSIGVAATEAGAVGEACAAIEEISAPQIASICEFRHRDLSGTPDWIAALQNLERYLACVTHSSA